MFSHGSPECAGALYVGKIGRSATSCSRQRVRRQAVSKRRYPRSVSASRSRPSVSEHRDRADRRAGAFAPFQRQADELELALPEQAFQIAQALDMREAEFEAG